MRGSRGPSVWASALKIVINVFLEQGMCMSKGMIMWQSSWGRGVLDSITVLFLLRSRAVHMSLYATCSVASVRLGFCQQKLRTFWGHVLSAELQPPKKKCVT